MPAAIEYVAPGERDRIDLMELASRERRERRAQRLAVDPRQDEERPRPVAPDAQAAEHARVLQRLQDPPLLDADGIGADPQDPFDGARHVAPYRSGSISHASSPVPGSGTP